MVVRKNRKKIIIDTSQCVKKSNELAISKLNKSLTLTQMQLLGYCIYTTQCGNGESFKRSDFEKTFNIDKYLTPRAASDSEKLYKLGFDPVVELGKERFKFWNVFGGIQYENGIFEYEFTSRMLAHITDLDKNYLTTDLTVVSKFDSSFSWTLYDYLKANYGCWYKTLSKQAVMNLFGVEKKKSYQNNTGLLKKYVIEPAIQEINKYTEIDVKCEPVLEGRSIVGFTFSWSTGSTLKKATERQMEVIFNIISTIIDDLSVYNSIQDVESRNRAIEIFKETLATKEVYFDGEVGMSIDLYSTVLKQLTQAIEDLNLLLVKSGEEPYDMDVPMIDWINN